MGWLFIVVPSSWVGLLFSSIHVDRYYQILCLDPGGCTLPDVLGLLYISSSDSIYFGSGVVLMVSFLNICLYIIPGIQVLGDSLSLPQATSLSVLSMLLPKLLGRDKAPKKQDRNEKWPGQSYNLIDTCYPSFPAKGGWS